MWMWWVRNWRTNFAKIKKIGRYFRHYILLWCTMNLIEFHRQELRHPFIQALKVMAHKFEIGVKGLLVSFCMRGSLNSLKTPCRVPKAMNGPKLVNQWSGVLPRRTSSLGYHEYPQSDLQWPKKTFHLPKDNYGGHYLNIWSTPAKYEIHNCFASWDTMFTRFLQFDNSWW